MKNIKAYFAAPIRGQRILVKTIIELVSYIQDDLGIPVLNDHVGQIDPIAYQAGKFCKKKEDVTAPDIERYDTALLDQATHVIAEISAGSTGTGREIEYSRTKGVFGKTPAKVLCIYLLRREFYASPFVRGMAPDKYPNVRIQSYKNLDEAKKLIKEFLQN